MPWVFVMPRCFVRKGGSLGSSREMLSLLTDSPARTLCTTTNRGHLFPSPGLRLPIRQLLICTGTFGAPCCSDLNQVSQLGHLPVGMYEVRTTSYFAAGRESQIWGRQFYRKHLGHSTLEGILLEPASTGLPSETCRDDEPASEPSPLRGPGLADEDLALWSGRTWALPDAPVHPAPRWTALLVSGRFAHQGWVPRQRVKPCPSYSASPYVRCSAPKPPAQASPKLD